MNQDLLESKIENFYQLCKYSQHISKTDAELIDTCINKAWPDAIARERFKGKANSLILQNCAEIKNLLKEYLKQLSKCSSESEFAQWHKDICGNTFCEMVPGIWQKFVNMALKHIYVVNYKTGRLRVFSSIFTFFHCPIDTIIAGILLKDMQAEGSYDDGVLSLISSISRSDKISWNSMSYSDYLKIQEVLSKIAGEDNYTPLQYDIIKWMPRK